MKAVIRSTGGVLYGDGKPTNVNNNTGLNVPLGVECFVDVAPIQIQILHRISRTQTGTGRGAPLNVIDGVPLLGGEYEKYGTVVIMARALP